MVLPQITIAFATQLRRQLSTTIACATQQRRRLSVILEENLLVPLPIIGLIVKLSIPTPVVVATCSIYTYNGM